MSKIIVSHNFSRLNALLKGLGDKRTIQQAVARSIKRTLPSIQRTAFTEIRSKHIMKIKASEMKLRARSYSVVGGSKSVAEQYGKVWFTPKEESLARFYARRVRKGTSIFGTALYAVKVNQYGAPALKDPSRSFLVPRGGGAVIFARTTGKRLPIEKVKGPGMAQLVQESGIMSSLVQVAERRYEAEFAVNVKFYAERALERAKKSAAKVSL
jgi:hypothetical protein